MKTLKTDYIALLLLALALPLSSCAGPKHSIRTQALYQHLHCAQKQSGLYLLEDQNAVNSSLHQQLPTRFNSPAPKQSDIDFQLWSQQHWLVLAAIGQKPTGGFNLDLIDNHSTIENKTLHLPLNIIEPQKGSIQTTAFTSPCLLLAVEKGNYTKILVTKQEGWLITLPP